MSPALLFVTQAIILIAVPYALWRLGGLHRITPMVVVQILFGIALGPSLLGGLAPDVIGPLFGPKALGSLGGLALLAVVFFAFLTGLHLDLAEFRGRGRSFTLVSLTSMVVPTVLGVGLGLWLVSSHPEIAGPKATPALFATGFGIAIGVTALPVLAAILREMDLLRDRAGQLALGYAAVNDGLLWMGIAALLAWAQISGHGEEGVLAADAALTIALKLALAAIYLVVTALWARPALTRLFDRIAPEGREGGDGVIVLTCAALLGSAAVTELIGLHYILGAFLAGVVMPKRLAAIILYRLEHFATLVLLPFFFTLTGLKVQIDLESSLPWLIFATATITTLIGKFIGTSLPARLTGESWRDALMVGTLMPCKGLMEVIVLTILWEAGIISGMVFSALVLMAVATTALTQPMTSLCGRLVSAKVR